MTYEEKRNKKERGQWAKIREKIKELKENHNADSFKWIALMSTVEYLEIRWIVKGAMAHTVIEKFEEMPVTINNSCEYFRQVENQSSWRRNGKFGKYYTGLNTVARNKANMALELEAHIYKEVKEYPNPRIIQENCLPLIFPTASANR